MQKELKISYEEYSSIEELPLKEDQILCAEAIKAADTAYAPYSKFHVGAALRLEDGTIIYGSNQENAAFPSGLCAERTAMFAAHANHPGKEFKSIAVVALQGGVIEDEPATPCGSCRQVMAEFQGPGKMSILLIGRSKIMRFSSVEGILPFIFTNI